MTAREGRGKKTKQSLWCESTTAQAVPKQIEPPSATGHCASWTRRTSQHTHTPHNRQEAAGAHFFLFLSFHARVTLECRNVFSPQDGRGLWARGGGGNLLRSTYYSPSPDTTHTRLVPLYENARSFALPPCLPKLDPLHPTPRILYAFLYFLPPAASSSFSLNSASWTFSLFSPSAPAAPSAPPAAPAPLFP